MSEDFGVVLQQQRGTMNMDPCMDAGWGAAEHHTRETPPPNSIIQASFQCVEKQGIGGEERTASQKTTGS